MIIPDVVVLASIFSYVGVMMRFGPETDYFAMLCKERKII